MPYHFYFFLFFLLFFCPAKHKIQKVTYLEEEYNEEAAAERMK